MPLEHTSPGFDLTALLNGFRPLFAVLEPEDVNQLSALVIKVLQGEGGTRRGPAPADRRPDQLPRRPRADLRPGGHQPHAGARQPRRARAPSCAARCWSCGALMDGSGPTTARSSAAPSTSVSELAGTTTDCCARRAAPAGRRRVSAAPPWSTMYAARARAVRAARSSRSAACSASSRSACPTSQRDEHLPVQPRLHDPRGRRSAPARSTGPAHEGVSRMRLPAVKLPALRGAFRDRDPFRIGIVATAVTVLLGVLVIGAQHRVSFGTTGYTAELEHTARPAGGGGGRRSPASTPARSPASSSTGKTVLVEFTVDSGIQLGPRHHAPRSRSPPCSAPTTSRSTRSGPGELADDRVPLAQTAVPYNLQDVIDKGTAARSTSSTPSCSARRSATVADTLRASGPEFLPALQGVDRVSRVVAERVRPDRAAAARPRASVTDQLSASQRRPLSPDAADQPGGGRADRAPRRRSTGCSSTSPSLSLTVHGDRRATPSADVGPALDNLDDGARACCASKDQEIRSALHTLAVGSRYLANATGNGPWVELLVPGRGRRHLLLPRAGAGASDCDDPVLARALRAVAVLGVVPHCSRSAAAASSGWRRPHGHRRARRLGRPVHRQRRRRARRPGRQGHRDRAARATTSWSTLEITDDDVKHPRRRQRRRGRAQRRHRPLRRAHPGLRRRGRSSRTARDPARAHRHPGRLRQGARVDQQARPPAWSTTPRRPTR